MIKNLDTDIYILIQNNESKEIKVDNFILNIHTIDKEIIATIHLLFSFTFLHLTNTSWNGH